MNSVVELRHLTKTYKTTTALNDVSLSIEQDSIYGLLGRNGAGKTTLMSILTAQNFATSGEVEVFGENPYENARVLSRMCFVRESQKYPEDSNAKHALANARLFFPHWDQALAEELIDEFRLPLKTTIKKLSRGQQSAVGVIIGLASRAEITFFDEPYLGFDAVARQTFYDRLIADYADHPRTVVLSSHLIDEVADLIENVIVIDPLSAVDYELIAEADLALTPVSLQQLIVRTTQEGLHDRSAADTESRSVQSRPPQSTTPPGTPSPPRRAAPGESSASSSRT